MKLTREGKRFLLAAVLIAVAAVNTGNNLIYLILSLMLSFIVLSYLILRLNLAGLLLEISAAGPVFAGEDVSVELLVHNNKKIPAYSVIIKSPDGAEEVYCGHIPGHGLFRNRIRIVFWKRGWHGYGDFAVQSGFPFILFRKSIPVKVSGHLLVYPKLLDVSEMIELVGGRQEEGLVAVKGRGDDVYSLRAYQYGDDWRRIHWRASARQEGFLVREFAEYSSQHLTVLLDNLLPYDKGLFETAVSLAASIAQYYIERGYPVRLVSAGTTIPFGGGKDQLAMVFDALALIAEQEEEMDLSGFRADGVTIAILKSGKSGMKAASSADMVIYADTL